MKLVKPKFEIIEQPSGIEGIYKMVEIAGRTCYKSEDKITEDSAKGFVDRMINSQHFSMLEHGTVYLNIPILDRTSYRIDSYRGNKYTCSNISKDLRNYYITTNLRVLIENGWLDDLKYICEPTEYHEKRYCVRFTCDRGVSHEFVRHRVFSFAQESTRYCNYSRDKFGNELTFIIPCWLNLPENSYGTIDNPNDAQFKDYNDPYEAEFINGLLEAEFRYMNLLKKWDDKIPDRRYKTKFKGNPWTPQQARAILPNALKTELVMTGFISDWKHFFELRCDKAAHSQARELAIPLREEFIKRGYIKD